MPLSNDNSFISSPSVRVQNVSAIIWIYLLKLCLWKHAKLIVFQIFNFSIFHRWKWYLNDFFFCVQKIFHFPAAFRGISFCIIWLFSTFLWCRRIFSMFATDAMTTSIANLYDFQFLWINEIACNLIVCKLYMDK